MKTILTAITIFVSAIFTAQSQTKYFYTTVSKTDKTVNYLFGFYPTTASYKESGTVNPYTSIKSLLINQKGAQDFISHNEKIMILLKSGELIRSYTTQAKEGDFAVNYTTKPGETHVQYYCFSGKVDVEDIDRVWYVLSDTQIFELLTTETKPLN